MWPSHPPSHHGACPATVRLAVEWLVPPTPAWPALLQVVGFVPLAALASLPVDGSARVLVAAGGHGHADDRPCLTALLTANLGRFQQAAIVPLGSERFGYVALATDWSRPDAPKSLVLTAIKAIATVAWERRLAAGNSDSSVADAAVPPITMR